MKTSLVLSASLLLFSTTAVANPVMVVQELRGQAVAGPHVKLTYTYNYGAPPSVTTHGTSQSPWVSAGSTSRDTGSGVKPLPIVEMCDCHVLTSTTLDYSIATSPSVTTQVQVPADPTGGDCTTPCQLADAANADAGEPDGPLSTGGTTGTGGAIGTGTGGAPDPGPPAKTKGGGCAFLATGTSPALLCLALLGLAIAARRRRP